jgi:hypothetical protein
VKLVDTPDSKSGSFAGVAVQVRPLVPSQSNVPSLSKAMKRGLCAKSAV